MIQSELMFDRKRPKWLFHQVRDANASPLTDEVCSVISKANNAQAIVAYSQTMPESPTAYPNTTRISGRLDGEAIIQRIGTTDASFFLCGPEPWTEAITESLKKTGVPENQIFSEGFGGPQSSQTKSSPSQSIEGGQSPMASVKHQVEFSLSGKSIGFTTNDQDLLSHAESHGVAIPSGCRSGSCGTCAVRLLKGKVKYKKPPQCEIAEDEILPCVCEPSENVSLQA